MNKKINDNFKFDVLTFDDNHKKNSAISKNEIEEFMNKVLHKQWYELWVKNFALNLSNIWLENSANELKLDIENKKSYPSIVIGRGPSLQKNEHLKLIAESNFHGNIICTDGILIKALKSGVTPQKFKNFFVVTIDAGQDIQEFYDDEIVQEFGKNITGIFSTVTHPETVKMARHVGIKPFWTHALFDYNEGEKSFNRTSALMVRAKNHSNGLPAIQTGGNVGTSAWFVAWRILKSKLVALTGIDHSWRDDDPWEKIVTHGFQHPNKVEINQESKTAKRLFPKIYNPEFDCVCILDPIFQYYSSALKEFIERSPSWLKTINATEGGCIFGKNIHCMKLKDFLHTLNPK